MFFLKRIGFTYFSRRVFCFLFFFCIHVALLLLLLEDVDDMDGDTDEDCAAIAKHTAQEIYPKQTPFDNKLTRSSVLLVPPPVAVEAPDA